MTDFLSRDQVLEADDYRSEVVEVPEWGGKIRVKGLSGLERERYEQSVGYLKGDRWVSKGNVQARLVVMCAIDADGRQLFGEDDIAKLTRKSSAALKRVVDACRRLSGLSDEDMDWLEGNSDGGQNEPSSSSSRSLSVAPSKSSSDRSAVGS